MREAPTTRTISGATTNGTYRRLRIIPAAGRASIPHTAMAWVVWPEGNANPKNVYPTSKRTGAGPGPRAASRCRTGHGPKQRSAELPEGLPVATTKHEVSTDDEDEGDQHHGRPQPRHGLHQPGGPRAPDSRVENTWGVGVGGPTRTIDKASWRLLPGMNCVTSS